MVTHQYIILVPGFGAPYLLLLYICSQIMISVKDLSVVTVYVYIIIWLRCPFDLKFL